MAVSVASLPSWKCFSVEWQHLMATLLPFCRRVLPFHTLGKRVAIYVLQNGNNFHSPEWLKFPSEWQNVSMEWQHFLMEWQHFSMEWQPLMAKELPFCNFYTLGKMATLFLWMAILCHGMATLFHCMATLDGKWVATLYISCYSLGKRVTIVHQMATLFRDW